MRIALISTRGTGCGGAVRAMRRLQTALEARGHEAIVLSLAPDRAPVGVVIEPDEAGDWNPRLAANANRYLQEAYLTPRRTSVSNTLFSVDIAGYDLSGCIARYEFDILNVHWATGMLSPESTARLVSGGCPVAITLHDMAAFTGGCHYPAGCTGYRTDCETCPQLRDDPLRIPHWNLQRKRHHLNRPEISAIAPSRWMAECAESSGVFRPGGVIAIPNSLETSIFRPMDRSQAKSGLGIDPQVKTLLFGAENNAEHRKGFDLLLEVARELRANPRLKSLIENSRLQILIFGGGTPELRDCGLPVRELGMVSDGPQLARIYNAADLTLLTSREDNLPNIVLEAMACGTPTLAFDVGGVPEIISTDIDGCLITALDSGSMASSAASLLLHDNQRLSMGLAARHTVEQRYALDVQALAYEHLFRSLVEGRRVEPEPGTLGRPASALPATPRFDQDVIGTATELIVQQQAEIDALRTAHAQAELAQARVRDVLRAAARDLLSSTSWRITGVLRRGTVELDVSRISSTEMLAVAVLKLFRSKSWEISAPLRMLVRSVRGISRKIKAGTSHSPVEKPDTATGVTKDPTVILMDPARLRRKRDTRGSSVLNPICLHLYHTDLWEEFKMKLLPIVDAASPLLVSLPESAADFQETIRRDFGERHCRIFVLENRGLDVYPFLYQFRWLKSEGLEPLTLTKLHTKRSWHHAPDYADAWRRQLYERLLANHPAIVSEFTKGALGMVCSREWWVSESDGDANFETERRVIEDACRVLQLPRSDRYVSGSMFVISFGYLRQLFRDVDLDAFLERFEPGYKPCDTQAHGFERAVCYGLRKFGYKVGLILPESPSFDDPSKRRIN